MTGEPDGGRGEGTPEGKGIDFVEYLVSNTLERALGLFLLLIDIVHESAIGLNGAPLSTGAHDRRAERLIDWRVRCTRSGNLALG
jgi:hypothetical protein